MSKVYTGAAKKQEAKMALEKRPCVALLYMTGCPHCEANKPAWDEFINSVPSGLHIIEIESEAAPDTVKINGKDESVNGFPTMIYKSKEEGKDKVISGEKHSGKEIEKELEIKKKGGSKRGGRHRTTRRALRRRDRKLGYRTFRNDVSFI